MNGKQSKRLRRYVTTSFGIADAAKIRKEYQRAKRLYKTIPCDQRAVFMALMKTTAEYKPVESVANSTDNA